MIEVLTKHSLPSVEDSDVHVTEHLADHLARVIDGSIPAVGITHTDERMPRHRGMHHWHRNLLLGALAELSSEVSLNDAGLRRMQGSPLVHRPEFSLETHNVHGDLEARLAPSPGVHEHLRLMLRLHTADATNGANVLCTNSAPGYFAYPGDDELFGSRNTVYDKARWRGYDEQGMQYSHKYLQAVPEMVDGDGCIVVTHEPEVYEYTETPCSSVIFRTMASMGAVTLHGFKSINTDEPRSYFASDITLFAQSL